MTGLDWIGQAIELFEASLKRGVGGQGPIRSVTEWARKTGYSVYHFTRLFSAVTGVSPKEYLSGRILTEAAKSVAESRRPLTLVAIEGGYPNYETFSRAFKRRFGLTPGQVRNLHHVPEAWMPRLVLPPKAGSQHLASKEPEILERGKFALVGLPFFIGPGTLSYHSQWATFLKVEGRVVRTHPPTFYQFSSWTEGEEIPGMSVLCGLEADPRVAQDPFFTLRQVPQARYLRFVHLGDVATIGSTYQYIYGNWLATHEVKPADGWEFQRYPDGSTTEIWIPLA